MGLFLNLWASQSRVTETDESKQAAIAVSGPGEEGR